MPSILAHYARNWEISSNEYTAVLSFIERIKSLFRQSQARQKDPQLILAHVATQFEQIDRELETLIALAATGKLPEQQGGALGVALGEIDYVIQDRDGEPLERDWHEAWDLAALQALASYQSLVAHARRLGVSINLAEDDRMDEMEDELPCHYHLILSGWRE